MNGTETEPRTPGGKGGEGSLKETKPGAREAATKWRRETGTCTKCIYIRRIAQGENPRMTQA